MDMTSYLLGKKSSGGGGTSDYSELSNKPSINNVTLVGNKSLSDLGIQRNVYYISYSDLSDTTKKQTMINELQAILTNIVNDQNNLQKTLIIIYEDNQQKLILSGKVNDFGVENGSGYLVFELKDRRLYAYQDTTAFYNVRIYYSNKTVTDITRSAPTINDYYKPLTVTNTTAFTPTGDYHPATKKYVDDLVGNISTILESLVTVSGGE